MAHSEALPTSPSPRPIRSMTSPTTRPSNTPCTASGMKSPPTPRPATVTRVATARKTNRARMSPVDEELSSHSKTARPGPSVSGSSNTASEARARAARVTPPTPTVTGAGRRFEADLARRVMEANSRPPRPAPTPRVTAPRSSPGPTRRSEAKPTTGPVSNRGMVTKVRNEAADATRDGSRARCATSSR